MSGVSRLLAGPQEGRPESLGEHLERLGPLFPVAGRWSSGAALGSGSIRSGGGSAEEGGSIGPARVGPARVGPARAGQAATGLVAEVERAGLTGRGGGAFPTAAKMAAVARGSSRLRSAAVVANGAEGEPESAKDGVLLARRPHLVLDGVEAASRAVGARTAVVCVSCRSPEALAAVTGALAERRRSRPEGIRVEVLETPDRFVAGEETALLSLVGGGEAKPRVVPPLPAEKGLDGRPTLVDNVETLAHVAMIARFGADWFREVGTAGEPGTALVTLAGDVRRPGVYEVALGSSLPSIIGAAGAGASAPAVLVGGCFGTWVGRGDVEGASLSVESLAPLGASPGAGVLVVLPDGVCGLAETARLATWLASESSGQCGPCVNGLAAVAGAMAELALPRGVPGSLLARLARWCGDIEGRGACRHPDGVVRLVGSALAVFAGEIEAHRRGSCVGARAWR